VYTGFFDTKFVDNDPNTPRFMYVQLSYIQCRFAFLVQNVKGVIFIGHRHCVLIYAEISMA